MTAAALNSAHPGPNCAWSIGRVSAWFRVQTDQSLWSEVYGSRLLLIAFVNGDTWHFCLMTFKCMQCTC